MVVKRVGSAPEKKSRVKRVVPRSSGEGLTKEELLGSLCAFTVRSYDPEYDGKFGVQPKVVVDVVVADEDEPEVSEGNWYFGNLARQIGENVEPGETGAGRVIKGGGQDGGHQWWGVDWATEDADYALVDKALDAVAPAPF